MILATKPQLAFLNAWKKWFDEKPFLNISPSTYAALPLMPLNIERPQFRNYMNEKEAINLLTQTLSILPYCHSFSTYVYQESNLSPEEEYQSQLFNIQIERHRLDVIQKWQNIEPKIELDQAQENHRQTNARLIGKDRPKRLSLIELTRLANQGAQLLWQAEKPQIELSDCICGIAVSILRQQGEMSLFENIS